eukprot:UN04441
MVTISELNIFFFSTNKKHTHITKCIYTHIDNTINDLQHGVCIYINN